MIRAELLDSMGTDLSVSNVARVSFNKWKEAFDSGDERLINYLSSHEHTTPFRHNQAQFRCKAPIFVARQLAKHQVGMSWNEVSLRYVKADDVWAPDVWREQAEDKKQGSGGAVNDPGTVDFLYERAVEHALEAYGELLALGVCREQARAVLPVGTYTEWIWTGSLQAWAHMVRLRTAPDAQAETREFAEQVKTQLTALWPVAMAALLEGRA